MNHDFGQLIARSPLPEETTGLEGKQGRSAATARRAIDFHDEVESALALAVPGS